MLEKCFKSIEMVFIGSYLRFYHICGSRFINLSLMFLKICEKCPLQTPGESWVAHKLKHNTSDMNDLGLLEASRTKMGMLIFFPPYPSLSLGYYVQRIKNTVISLQEVATEVTGLLSDPHCCQSSSSN